MNQLLQYVLLFGVLGVFFVSLYEVVLADIIGTSQSQHDRLERYKLQAAEYIRLVDITDTEPASADIINAGSDITIKKIYVDGVEANYTINGISDTNGLQAGRLVNITTDTNGSTIAIVTENDRVFRFG